MGWQTALISAISAASFQQQGAIGKYNQAVAERSAKVLENQAEAIEKKNQETRKRVFDKLYIQVEYQKEMEYVSYKNLKLPTKELV